MAAKADRFILVGQCAFCLGVAAVAPTAWPALSCRTTAQASTCTWRSPGPGPPSAGQWRESEPPAMRRRPHRTTTYRTLIGHYAYRKIRTAMANNSKHTECLDSDTGYSLPLGQFLRAILDHRIYPNHAFSLRITAPRQADIRRLRGGFVLTGYSELHSLTYACDRSNPAS